MVNTRRMESVGSTHDSGIRYRTRGSDELNRRAHSSNGSDSGSDESHEEDSKPLRTKSKIALPSRVRELRSRFVCNDIKFSAHRLRRTDLRSSRKRVSLDDRHPLAIYSSRKMDEDLDMYNNISDEDLYHPRALRLRHSRPSRTTTLARIERRTALSLRPISLKSYADPRSPLTMNSDSDDKELVLGVRRSTRQRKVVLENMSWLADNQMPKVGYPNFDSTEYSEEDSRDAQVLNAKTMNHLERTRRSTRHSSRSGKGTTRLFNFESPMHTRRTSRNEEKTDAHELKNGASDLNDKENEESVAVGVKSRKNGKGADKPEQNGEVSSVEGKVKVAKAGKDDDAEGNKANEENTEQASSESEEIRRVRTRRQAPNRVASDPEKYSPRRTRSRKISGSSSSSEVGKVYSLRDRPPKPPQNTLRTSRVRSAIKRRHFTRRYKEPSSSDTDISSDGDDRCRKTIKNSKNHEQRMKSGSGSKIVPIGPEKLDANIRFSSIGGLDEHIRCLKEMIVLPMMYPEVFRQFQIQPPRGILFHGPPGTGKTLIARALANECNFGSRKISFFMRKGADLLSKWIGESEKQLRCLFEQAAEMKPSIIFFDELDGLAPVRSARQDQVHASIVSTLLALMDGIDDRGEVIVIGATNRIDAIDPALRRPGRFDRELLFPLPARKEREEILNIHVGKWTAPPSSQLLSYLADNAVGYCGSDLRALCSEAVIQGFRRSYPQVYVSNHRLQLDPKNVTVEKVDFLRAKSLLIPASQRIRYSVGRKLLPILQPILREPLKDTLALLEQNFPHGFNPALVKVKLSTGVKPAQLLLTGEGPEHGQTLHLAPAILYQMEHIHSYTIDLATLNCESGISAEETAVQVFNEARRNVPSIVYVPCIDELWTLVSDVVKAIIISQLSQLDPNIPILFLATANKLFLDMPEQIQNIFSTYRNEVYHLTPPSADVRRNFFKPLIVDASLRQPKVARPRPCTPPVLPRAPTPPPTPLSEEQSKRVYETEERTLRELRIFLRDMCKKLANNKLFYMFTKPVDTEEVPDYTTIIKQPMDLETMMTKVDFHQYECAKDFLTDIELIVQNALEYNPAKTSADKQIRHRACSLRDYAYALIKSEMDSDFEDKCQGIARTRKDRKVNVSKYLPPYIHTPTDATTAEVIVDPAVKEEESKSSAISVASSKTSPCRKRKVSSWQRGYLTSRKRKRKITLPDGQNEEKMSSGEDSKENSPHVCSLEQSLIEVFGSSQERSSSQGTSSQSTIVPLSINCDSHCSKQPSPCKSQLSDLLSPSELLDDPLQFDDIDEALHEVSGMGNTEGKVVAIDVSTEELQKVLEETVKDTADLSLQLLLDLHNQMSCIIKKYLKTRQRKHLPKELRWELMRFKQSTSDVSNSPSGNH